MVFISTFKKFIFFQNQFVRRIDAGSTRDASEYHVDLKNRIAENLQHILLPYFLRRTKDVSKTLRVNNTKNFIIQIYFFLFYIFITDTSSCFLFSVLT